ncbi:Ppx/GppA phosphatase family protein [Magnetospirillum sp. UT-4]|uniref:Ppx/GppA phosphatase family protein n=1 Tax=Magnetospirillum sp. UT-4 TaxID=2681467 RepID=UPI001380E40E|nr:Ppx/GppA phosphatase family protein [Magnetospirillum sp. UT-4]CAA7612875.1 putative exopolyphosphatase [Magnetospirillum sp. UT-4]
MSFVAPSPAPAAADGVYAAIDLGTNNCRMLVARPHGHAFRVVDCYSRITRLGEGLAVSGRLSEAAMERTLAALSTCAERMARCRVSRARLVATEACRRAANGADFAARVAERTGLALDIIDAEQEAALALAGCASLVEPGAEWVLVFDIGGGSTELVWVRNHAEGHRVEGVQSLPLGVVTLAEAVGQALYRPDSYLAIVADIAGRLWEFERRHGIARRLAGGRVQMLGTSGTVTTLAALHLDLERYDRSRIDGLDLGFHHIAAVTTRLAAMSAAERALHPCIGPERADLVLAGCAILQAMCGLWPLTTLRVADRGVREGILLGLMRQDGALARPQAEPAS